ncbi:hypothetical protein MSAN_02055000 [Mycena sanguinolenta]|uniref:DUF6535 domain-containing protein n=1 Tax=Mycena sanguinolenta TaxID=230812 RepID=A0A8H6XHF8_9AGAR|nr:hypothetical protein MSAN_02055000 [Mycena sanguinolenta]
MGPSQELESGAEGPSARASVFQRLISAVCRVLHLRKDCEPEIPHPVNPGPQRRNYIDPDREKARPSFWPRDPQEGHYSDAENEEACAKIWSIYVGEAERYDAALVESWKADMEGMLIFSGLFSASLTAFLIESYKVLQPDSGDLTVAGIAQLSQQLAAIANNMTFVSPLRPSFTPTIGSLWCNALWFISLSCSLTCALLATLVEQWAREFLHKTEMRPSPLRRARVFSFLYFGLKHFRMHTIVDTIPFLLHVSLLLFFAGLVAFLLPVNRVMMYLMCIVLIVFVVLYTVLTILPVLRLDCPYRTPLSAPLWSILQSPFAFFAKSDPSAQQTMTEAVVVLAQQETKRRDQRAIAWTLESLTDDIELLPFVEAIPDIIYGPNGFRHRNDALFDSLLGTIEMPSPLVARIGALIAGTEGMSRENPLRTRRCTAGDRAIWALCMMPSSWDRLFNLDQSLFDRLGAATKLAVTYQAQRWVHHLLRVLRDLLAQSSDEVLPTIQKLIGLLITYQNIIGPPSRNFERNPCSLHFAELKVIHDQVRKSIPTAADLARTRQIVAVLYDSHDWAYNSLVSMGKFISSGLLSSPMDETKPPFEPLWTCYSILSEIESSPPKRLVMDRVPSFPPVIQNPEYSVPPPLLDTYARIVFRMLPFLSDCNIHRYLGQRKETEAIRYALVDCDVGELARKLVSSTSPIYDDMNSTILAITTAANCLDPDSVAIRFLDEVIKQGPPELTQSTAILAVRYLRQLRQVNNELYEINQTLFNNEFHEPGSSSHPPTTLVRRVQGICHDALFHELSPLFLPVDVHIVTVVDSLQIHLVNKYISFLSDFFTNTIPMTSNVGLSAFHPFDTPHHLPVAACGPRNSR